MIDESKRFSDRHGFKQINENEIIVRNEAPHELRSVIVDIAYECGYRPNSLRQLVCQILRVRKNLDNWSEYPNIDVEVRRLIDETEWYKVYDLIEAIVTQPLMRESCKFLNGQRYRYSDNYEKFEKKLNMYFVEKGIGWKLSSGKLEARNPEALEQAILSATTVLQESGSKTAQSELHEALVDLSRRPTADITGAIQHSMAALECVARNVTGEKGATLGEILKKYPKMVTPPLNIALEKLWGFASEYGRHIREGRNPEFIEAQLVVGTCASAVTYLVGKKNDLKVSSLF